MLPNSHDTEHHAALLRLRRMQRTEGRRIRQAVAVADALTTALLRAPCRAHPLAEARQVAMYLHRADLRWPTITRTVPFPTPHSGRLLGGHDHSTALHDIAAIATRLGGDHGDADEAAALRTTVHALHDHSTARMKAIVVRQRANGRPDNDS